MVDKKLWKVVPTTEVVIADIKEKYSVNVKGFRTRKLESLVRNLQQLIGLRCERKK